MSELTMRNLSTKSLLALLAVVLVLISPHREVYSQPATVGDSAQKADQLFQKSRVLYTSGKMREAREALLSAWALKKSYDIAANLGTVELELGLYRDAAEHMGYSLRTFPPTGKKKHLAETKQQLAEARAQVGTLGITVSVEGAEVFVDGKLVGLAPLVDAVYVEPGARTVEASARGYTAGKVVVQVAKGGTEVVNLALAAAVAPVVAGSAGPSASGGPAVPASGSALAPPPPPRIGSSAVVPPPVESGGPSTALLVTGGVAGGLALVAGVAFAVLANGKASDAEQQAKELGAKAGQNACITGAFVSECDAIHLGPRQDQVRFANLSAWSFAGAGTLGAGTLIYALAAPKAARENQVQMSPTVVSHGGGIMLRGAW
jgi:uncharacterized membrane protein